MSMGKSLCGKLVLFLRSRSLSICLPKKMEDREGVLVYIYMCVCACLFDALIKSLVSVCFQRTRLCEGQLVSCCWLAGSHFPLLTAGLKVSHCV